MKIFVAGLWHLGAVTAACLAHSGYEVIAYDPSSQLIEQFNRGIPPLYEPQLEDILKEALALKKIIATTDYARAKEADIIWITFDTPVDENDIADVAYVRQQTLKILNKLQTQCLVILSSQMPVGTAKTLRNELDKNHPNNQLSFACIPENLRLGNAIKIFTKPDRIVVGIEREQDKLVIQQLLAPFSAKLIWMTIASAEMTKHAINAFLATSVIFMNEIASLCESVGANAREVEKGLKSEERIGVKAYLRPGNAIAGGTLLRDINFLQQFRAEAKDNLFAELMRSNQRHKDWLYRKLKELFKDLKAKNIAVLGLTYKAKTDTLRRSTAIGLAEKLYSEGANVHAFDPVIFKLPDDMHYIKLHHSLNDAICDTDAIIVANDCTEFKDLLTQVSSFNKIPMILDESGYLFDSMHNHQQVRYFTVGVEA